MRLATRGETGSGSMSWTYSQTRPQGPFFSDCSVSQSSPTWALPCCFSCPKPFPSQSHPGSVVKSFPRKVKNPHPAARGRSALVLVPFWWQKLPSTWRFYEPGPRLPSNTKFSPFCLISFQDMQEMIRNSFHAFKSFCCYCYQKSDLKQKGREVFRKFLTSCFLINFWFPACTVMFWHF